MKPDTDMNQLLVQAALTFAEQGFRVFPCAIGSKRPAFGARDDGWSVHATRDVIRILSWWQGDWAGCNILIVCGQRSDLTVLDFDTKDGKPGEAVAVQVLGHDWKSRYRYIYTPGKGYHVYFRWQESWGNRKLSRLGLDVQGDGSYVLVPPSRLTAEAGEKNPGQYLEVNPHLPLVNEVDEALDARVQTLLGGAGSAPASGPKPGVPDWRAARGAFTQGRVDELWGRLPLAVRGYLVGEWGEHEADRTPAMKHIAVSLAKLLAPEEMLAFYMLCEGPREYASTGNREGRAGSEDAIAAWLWDDIQRVGLNVFDVFRDVVDGADFTGGGAMRELERVLVDLAEREPDPVAEDELLKRIQERSGFGLRAIRRSYTAIAKRLAEERRVAKKAEVLGPAREYVYVEHAGAFWCLVEPGWYGRTAVKDMWGLKDDQLRDVLAVMPRVRRVSYRPFNQWAAGYDEETARFNFNAGTVRRELNIWSPSPCRPALGAGEDDVRPWLRLMDVTMEVRREDREHLLDWLAFTLQHPEVKVNHMLLLGGDPGIGKDTFIQPVLDGLGRTNVLEVPGADAMLGSFDHPGFTHASLLVLQELRAGSRWQDAQASYDALKNKLASPPEQIPVNLKNVQQYMIANLVNVLAMTNHRDAVQLEQDDRRMFMVWAEGRPKRDPEYWNRLNEWLDEGGRELVVGYLLGRDVSGFDPKGHPPVSDWKDDAREDSLSPLAQVLAELRAERDGCCAWDVVTAEQLLELAQARLLGHQVVTPTQLGKAVSSLRWKVRRVNAPRGEDTHRGKRRLYVLRNESVWMNMPEMELLRALAVISQLSK